MRNLIVPILSWAIINLLACNSAPKHDDIIKEESEIPSVIDSLEIADAFNDAKWTLYLLQCDDTPKTSDNKFPFGSPIPLSQMDLVFDSLHNNNDTVDMFFTFNYKDRQVRNCNNMDLIKEIVDDKRVIKGNDSIVWYLYYCASFQDCQIGPVDPQKIKLAKDRRVNPLQPDVIKFLNDNKKDLHPWLYREAVKRGVIKDSSEIGGNLIK